MKIALDATPLLGARTGVGRYVEQLVGALLGTEAPTDVMLVPLTLRGAGDLTWPDSAHVTIGRRRAPARLLRELWARVPFPPAELLSGRVDVWHGTNFVLPPTRRAAGVVTVHDLTYLRHPQWVTPAVLRYQVLVPASLRRARAVCTPSHTVRGELLDAYPWLDAARVHATPLTVDPELFSTPVPDAEARKRLGLPPEYTLFLGSSEPRKGLDTLLGAYRLLHSRGVDLPPLVRVGPPGWGPTADLTGLSDRLVRTLGYLPGDELRTVIAGATLMTYPSRYEGFGLPPLEALACGVGVVASDLPVHREVLGDQATYAPVDDVEALAEAITTTLHAVGPDAASCVEARRARAATFTPQQLAAATLAAYSAAQG